MTVKEINQKIRDIEDAKHLINNRITPYGHQYPAQEPLYDVVKLLTEYQKILGEAEVYI